MPILVSALSEEEEAQMWAEMRGITPHAESMMVTSESNPDAWNAFQQQHGESSQGLDGERCVLLVSD